MLALKPRFRNDFPSILNDFWKDLEPQFSVNQPAVNITEDDNAFHLEVAAPGLEKKDFNVAIDNNLLTIEAKREEKEEEKGKNFTRREFNYTSFTRTFSLPESVNADAILAEYNNGILKLELPKKEEAKPVRKAIQIK